MVCYVKALLQVKTEWFGIIFSICGLCWSSTWEEMACFHPCEMLGDPAEMEPLFYLCMFLLGLRLWVGECRSVAQWGSGFWKEIASPVPVPLSSTLWASLTVCLLASSSTETVSHLTLLCPGAACLLSNEGNEYIFLKLLQFPYHHHLYC